MPAHTWLSCKCGMWASPTPLLGASSWMTWKTAPVVRRWWLNVQESCAYLNREEKAWLSCHPQWTPRPRPSHVQEWTEALRPETWMPCYGYASSETWRQDEKWARGGVNREPSRGGWDQACSRSIAKWWGVRSHQTTHPSACEAGFPGSALVLNTTKTLAEQCFEVEPEYLNISYPLLKDM